MTSVLKGIMRVAGRVLGLLSTGCGTKPETGEEIAVLTAHGNPAAACP